MLNLQRDYKTPTENKDLSPKFCYIQKEKSCQVRNTPKLNTPYFFTFLRILKGDFLMHYMMSTIIYTFNSI